MRCCDVQELEAQEYARKGVNLTPELWLVKLLVGAVGSRWVASTVQVLPVRPLPASQRCDTGEVLDVQSCTPSDQMSACSYDEQD